MSASWLGVKLGSAAGVARFERFFRIGARLDVDKQDLKRYPITKGLQESIQAFRAIDAEIELQPILDYLASRELREAGSGNCHETASDEDLPSALQRPSKKV